MADIPDYYTERGYDRISQHESGLTSTLEDYLEMICRLIKLNGYTRVNELAARLHVKPSSATRMLLKLSDTGYVDYKKYGVIRLTQKGEKVGNYLLKRHDTITEFFGFLNSDNSEAFMEAELAEHILSPESVEAISRLNEHLRSINYGKKTGPPCTDDPEDNFQD